MKKYDKKEIKQIIILGIILILVIVFSIVADKILFSDEENVTVNSTSTSTSNSTSNVESSSSTVTSSNEYTINGYTKEEWEKLEPYINENLYSLAMELFSDENNFKDSSNLEIDEDDYDVISSDDGLSDEEEETLDNIIKEYLN